MKIRESLESIRDVTLIAYDAAKLICSDVIEYVDTKFANAINGDEDE